MRTLTPKQAMLLMFPDALIESCGECLQLVVPVGYGNVSKLGDIRTRGNIASTKRELWERCAERLITRDALDRQLDHYHSELMRYISEINAAGTAQGVRVAHHNASKALRRWVDMRVLSMHLSDKQLAAQ